MVMWVCGHVSVAVAAAAAAVLRRASTRNVEPAFDVHMCCAACKDFFTNHVNEEKRKKRPISMQSNPQRFAWCLECGMNKGMVGRTCVCVCVCVCGCGCGCLCLPLAGCVPLPTTSCTTVSPCRRGTRKQDEPWAKSPPRRRVWRVSPRGEGTLLSRTRMPLAPRHRVHLTHSRRDMVVCLPGPERRQRQRCPRHGSVGLWRRRGCCSGG